jgi:hypothetical protein
VVVGGLYYFRCAQPEREMSLHWTQYGFRNQQSALRLVKLNCQLVLLHYHRFCVLLYLSQMYGSGFVQQPLYFWVPAGNYGEW